MKIIERPDENWNKLLTCMKCLAKLEANIGDLCKTYYDGDQRDSAYWEYYVTCPVCSSRLSIPARELNYAVQQIAKDIRR